MRTEDEDGRPVEVLFTLALPLPFDVVAGIGEALRAALGPLGYVDITMLADGTNRVVATPPTPAGTADDIDLPEDADGRLREGGEFEGGGGS